MTTRVSGSRAVTSHAAARPPPGMAVSITQMSGASATAAATVPAASEAVAHTSNRPSFSSTRATAARTISPGSATRTRTVCASSYSASCRSSSTSIAMSRLGGSCCIAHGAASDERPAHATRFDVDPPVG